LSSFVLIGKRSVCFKKVTDGLQMQFVLLPAMCNTNRTPLLQCGSGQPRNCKVISDGVVDDAPKALPLK